MTGILLCAGFGTRLHPLTKDDPKALLPVQERPILDYLMEQLLELDALTTLHLVSNGRMFAHFYRWKEPWEAALAERGISLHLHCNGAVEEEERPGAVGDLARILRRVDASNGVLVSAGDSIYRFPLASVMERYQQHGQTTVMGLYEHSAQRLRDQSVLDMDEQGRIRAVVDQPEDPPSRWVCPSFYVFSPEAAGRVPAYLQQGGDEDTLGGLIHFLAQDEALEVVRMPPSTPESTFRSSDLRFHINTRYQYNKANEVLVEEPLMKFEREQV